MKNDDEDNHGQFETDEWVRRSQSANSLASAAFATKDSHDNKDSQDDNDERKEDSDQNSFRSGSFSFSDSEGEDKSEDEDAAKSETDRDSPEPVKRTFFPKSHPAAQIITPEHENEIIDPKNEDENFAPIKAQDDDDNDNYDDNDESDKEKDEDKELPNNQNSGEPLSLSLTSQPRLENPPQPEDYPVPPKNEDFPSSTPHNDNDEDPFDTKSEDTNNFIDNDSNNNNNNNNNSSSSNNSHKDSSPEPKDIDNSHHDDHDDHGEGEDEGAGEGDDGSRSDSDQGQGHGRGHGYDGSDDGDGHNDDNEDNDDMNSQHASDHKDEDQDEERFHEAPLNDLDSTQLQFDEDNPKDGEGIHSSANTQLFRDDHSNDDEDNEDNGQDEASQVTREEKKQRSEYEVTSEQLSLQDSKIGDKEDQQSDEGSTTSVDLKELKKEMLEREEKRKLQKKQFQIEMSHEKKRSGSGDDECSQGGGGGGNQQEEGPQMNQSRPQEVIQNKRIIDSKRGYQSKKMNSFDSLSSQGSSFHPPHENENEDHNENRDEGNGENGRNGEELTPIDVKSNNTKGRKPPELLSPYDEKLLYVTRGKEYKLYEMYSSRRPPSASSSQHSLSPHRYQNSSPSSHSPSHQRSVIFGRSTSPEDDYLLMPRKDSKRISRRGSRSPQRNSRENEKIKSKRSPSSSPSSSYSPSSSRHQPLSSRSQSQPRGRSHSLKGGLGEGGRQGEKTYNEKISIRSHFRHESPYSQRHLNREVTPKVKVQRAYHRRAWGGGDGLRTVDKVKESLGEAIIKKSMKETQESAKRRFERENDDEILKEFMKSRVEIAKKHRKGEESGEQEEEEVEEEEIVEDSLNSRRVSKTSFGKLNDENVQVDDYDDDNEEEVVVEEEEGALDERSQSEQNQRGRGRNKSKQEDRSSLFSTLHDRSPLSVFKGKYKIRDILHILKIRISDLELNQTDIIEELHHLLQRTDYISQSHLDVICGFLEMKEEMNEMRHEFERNQILLTQMNEKEKQRAREKLQTDRDREILDEKRLWMAKRREEREFLLMRRRLMEQEEKIRRVQSSKKRTSPSPKRDKTHGDSHLKNNRWDLTLREGCLERASSSRDMEYIHKKNRQSEQYLKKQELQLISHSQRHSSRHRQEAYSQFDYHDRGESHPSQRAPFPSSSTENWNWNHFSSFDTSSPRQSNNSTTSTPTPTPTPTNNDKKERDYEKWKQEIKEKRLRAEMKGFSSISSQKN